MRNILFILLAFVIIGFLDASYLSYEHYTQVIPPCSLHTWFSDCGAVLTSKYSVLFCMPVSLFGAFFYISAFFLVIYGIISPHKKILYALGFLITLSTITSLYFIGLHIFI